MPIEIKKVLIPEFGGPEVIQIVHDTLPDPPAHHVQVKIIYSGFAGADINMRLGWYPQQKAAPLTPGYSFVGTVHANGPHSSKFKVGDLVACLTVYDSEATYSNQPEKYLVPVPKDLDLKVATALVLDWNTSYGMLSDRDWKGKKVFIHGMSGAVGYGLMSLAMLAGAEVYGTASARNHAAIRKLGATPFVYTDKKWIKAMQDIGGVHGVFDALGFESFDESYSILSSTERSKLWAYGANLETLNGGPARSILWPTLKLLSHNLKFWSHKATVFWWITRTSSSFKPNLLKLFAMAAEGKIQVPIKRVFDLDDVATAHRDWTRLTGMGSVVVKVA